MELIEARQLSKLYPSGSGEVTALDNVSFKIASDEFVAIMGPSGSGKSTLMNLIGLLDRPSSGALFLSGEDVTGLSADQHAAIRNSQIGFIFQSYNLLNRSTALENVALPLVYAGVPEDQRRRRASEALEDVGLSERSRHWPAQLSGGEQQRVAIARAMVTNPAVVLADEPTGALDTRTGRSILDLFRQLNQQGRAIVMVTHDKSVAVNASRILTLSDGALIEDAPPSAEIMQPGDFYLHRRPQPSATPGSQSS